jgi:N-acetylmuramoyl-L-alanine amidase CwlA
VAYTSKNGKIKILAQLLTREEWLAYVKTYDFGSIPPDRIVLHHTWSPTLAQWAGLKSIKSMCEYYAGKGWTAGPHIYVAPEGIWLFTPMEDVGIHAGTGNANIEFITKPSNYADFKKLKWYSIGVELVGDYDKVRPSGELWENAKVVLGSLCRRFGKSPEQAIGFHRDFSTKSCPGWAVNKPWVQAEVNTWLASTNIDTSGLTIVAAPRISAARFAAVLAQYKSPAAAEAAGLYRICVAQGIDPAVALAFFAHESSCGTLGICKLYDTKNWGNVRSPEDPTLGKATPIPGRGNFAKYPSWSAGLLDWCKRLKGPKYAGCGLTTVEKVLPKYAPGSDGNSPAKYAEAVRTMIAAWAAAG